MATVPYLHLPGTCREAMDVYARVLGGTNLRLMPYADMPDAPPGFAASDRIMHAEMDVPGGRLMASDFPPGMPDAGQAAVSVMQTFPDVAATRAAFDALMDGGEVIQPFGPTFFTPGFGMLKDRFGTHWILSADAA